MVLTHDFLVRFVNKLSQDDYGQANDYVLGFATFSQQSPYNSMRISGDAKELQNRLESLLCALRDIGYPAEIGNSQIIQGRIAPQEGSSNWKTPPVEQEWWEVLRDYINLLFLRQINPRRLPQTNEISTELWVTSASWHLPEARRAMLTERARKALNHILGAPGARPRTKGKLMGPDVLGIIDKYLRNGDACYAALKGLNDSNAEGRLDQDLWFKKQQRDFPKIENYLDIHRNPQARARFKVAYSKRKKRLRL